MEENKLIVRLATADDKHYAETITLEMEESAKARGTGIAKRSPSYLERKMEEGKAIIATTPDGKWVGFCYIEAWEHDKYVANSGLIVSPVFRKTLDALFERRPAIITARGDGSRLKAGTTK